MLVWDNGSDIGLEKKLSSPPYNHRGENMRRSIAHGGRRCPGYSDPARRAAYNAKRRAKYAFEKMKKDTAQSTPGIALSEEKADAPFKAKKTTVETVVDDLKKAEENYYKDILDDEAYVDYGDREYDEGSSFQVVR